MRGLAFNCPNIVKWDMVAHISRYSSSEVRDLLMYVLQKGRAIPPSKLHDKCITISLHIEGHCAFVSKGVCIYHMIHYDLFFSPRARTYALIVLLICMGCIPPFLLFV